MDLRTFAPPKHHGFLQGTFCCAEELNHYVSLAACHCRVLSVKPYKGTPEHVLDVLADLSADGIVTIVSHEPKDVDLHMTGPDYHADRKAVYVYMENIYDVDVCFLHAWRREMRPSVVRPALTKAK